MFLTFLSLYHKPSCDANQRGSLAVSENATRRSLLQESVNVQKKFVCIFARVI